MYMCDARRGFNIRTREGTQLTGKTARIWRCRPDGTGLEWISAGGFDNTIELIFMPSGETIGTMTYFTDPRNGFRDALMHWVEGGVYPKPYPVIVEDKLKLTGDLMPVMTRMPRVSPAGLMRYRGTTFGEEYRGNLFSAQFNTGRIMRHVVTAEGATFRTADEPFMRYDDLEMHPTDVLEDADGSLLVVNTGGWFIAGCPLSVVAKEDIHGSIIRIRRKGAPLIRDPWGRNIDFKTLPADALADLIRDTRPAVRDKAIEQMIVNGKPSIEPLKNILASSGSGEERTAAVFALYRIQTADAMSALLPALDDKSEMVRTACTRVLGLAKDPRAVDKLSQMLVDASLAVRRQAATALGQTGDARAVEALIAASANPGDRFVEHAIIYSLIRLGETGPLVKALKDPSQNIRRTALVALDQVDASPLRETDLVPFLQSNDPELQKTGMRVAAHHPHWSEVVISYLKPHLGNKDLTKAEAKMIMDVLTTFSGNPSVQLFISSGLQDTSTPADRKSLLLDVINQSPRRELPDGWVEQLRNLLRDSNPDLQAKVLGLVQSRRIPALNKDLERIIDDANASDAFRLKALGARIMSQPALSDEQFKTVTDFLGASHEPYIRQAAVGLLVQADLSDAQLTVLAKEHIPDAGIFLLPGLVSAFEGNTNEAVGKSLVSALSGSSHRLDNLSVESLQRILKTYSASVSESAKPLMKSLMKQQAARLAALEVLQSTLGHGDVGEGRRLFYGKALCSTCHAVTGAGGDFGPDLTNIGEIRSEHDILEAILYPGASLAREYETSRVVTRTTTYTGIIKEQLAETLIVETGPGVYVRITRNEITAIEPQNISLMPPGLDKQLTTEELSDLMAYLSTLPDGMGHLRYIHREDKNNGKTRGRLIDD